MTTQPAPLPRILLVDDERGVLFALRDLLEEEFDVLTAERGEDALRLVEADPTIELVMSDQRMPGMQGDELLSRVRAISSAARILCSGYADVQAILRSVNRGKIVAFIEKPWNLVQLKATLREALQDVRSRKALERTQQLFGDLLRSMPHAFYVKDPEQRFVSVNSQFLSAIGSPEASAVIGRRLSDLVPQPDAAEELEALEREAMSEPEPRQYTLQLPTLDGRQRAFRTTLSALRSEAGELRGVVCVSADLDGLPVAV